MCGLFGIAGEACDLDRARSALEALKHRGPDQWGEWTDASTYIGHRRLSILDESEAGQQPMVGHGLVVSVNGEIYNYKALRDVLTRAGFTFHSDSDSEVVLHGSRHWGVSGLVERLEGMYAAVVYDQDANTLSAFRDRVGIKPLYYGFQNGRLIWGSELKAITAYLAPEALNLDAHAALDFLVYRYIPAPRSIYREVRKLPAATLLQCQLSTGELVTTKYWQLPVSVERSLAWPEFKDRFDATLRESVVGQLVSDVPLGLLLSGGLDSSAVALQAAAENPGMKSFSLSFADLGRDETPVARAMSEHLGTAHYTREFDGEHLDSLETLMSTWFDEPFADTSALPTYQVCAFAREQITVALSGDGGDELFGGYGWYQRYAAYTRSRLGLPWPKRGLDWPFARAKQHIELLSTQDPLWLYARLRGAVGPGSLTRWSQRLGIEADYDPLWAYRAVFYPEMGPRRAAQIMDFHTYLPDDILTKVDRVSMAVSLECRPALLGTELVEFAFSLPDTITYLGDELKGGMRKALSPDLPEDVVRHAKQGFSIPAADWRARRVHAHGSLQESMLQAFTGDAWR